MIDTGISNAGRYIHFQPLKSGNFLVQVRDEQDGLVAALHYSEADMRQLEENIGRAIDGIDAPKPAPVAP